MPANSDRERSLLEQLVLDDSALQLDEEYSGGSCFYCDCEEDLACLLEQDGVAITCHWYRRPDHRGFAVCSNPKCVKAYIADRGAP